MPSSSALYKHKFKLSFKPSVEENGWTDLKYPKNRAIFLAPSNKL
jgi:hypothetical protein